MKLQPVLLAVIAMFLLFAIGCEGPEGPQGPAGETDTVYVNYELACLSCHSEANMTEIMTSYSGSGHASASTTSYAGGRASCSRCHSSEGFLNYLAGTPGVDPADIPYPTAISCSTCHGNHRSLEEDLEVPLRTTAAVTAISDSTVLDFENESNLCGTCHQSRRDYTYYTAIDSLDGVAVGANEVAINSSHAGPHHGPQINFIFGNGGTVAGSPATHADAGCTTCHMGEADGAEGGHSFYPNAANCNASGCHTDVTDFDVNGKQTDFDTRMAAIAEALVTEGALNGDATEGYHPNVGIVSDDAFDAFWSYMMLYEDHSHGVHNPGFTTTLLSRAEAKLGL